MGRNANHDRVGHLTGVVEHPAGYGIEPHATFAGGVFDRFATPGDVAMVGLPCILQVRTGCDHRNQGRVPCLELSQGSA